eukprot:12903109-Prorocentrum_lima.AAC.1
MGTRASAPKQRPANRRRHQVPPPSTAMACLRLTSKSARTTKTCKFCCSGALRHHQATRHKG